MTAYIWIAFAGGMALSLLCRMFIARTFAAYRVTVPHARRKAGHAAQAMLRGSGVALCIRDGAREGYDAKARALTLSTQTAQSPSYTALCMALHECGHALQRESAPKLAGALHAAYRLLVRLTILGTLCILVGLIGGWDFVWQAGVGTYLALLLFNLFGLVREGAASRRARAFAFENGLLDAREMVPMIKLLWAANLCGVAATYTAALQLVKGLLALLVGRMQPREAVR